MIALRKHSVISCQRPSLKRKECKGDRIGMWAGYKDWGRSWSRWSTKWLWCVLSWWYLRGRGEIMMIIFSCNESNLSTFFHPVSSSPSTLHSFSPFSPSLSALSDAVRAFSWRLPHSNLNKFKYQHGHWDIITLTAALHVQLNSGRPCTFSPIEQVRKRQC